MMSNATAETAIGAAVIATAIGFFAYAYAASGQGEGGDGYRLVAEFDNAGSVATGTDVRIAGLKVGTVVAQELNPENFQAKLTLAIEAKIVLPDDSAARVSSEGLLGAMFIAVEPGGSPTPFKDGDQLSLTQGAVDIWSLISDAMFKPKPGAETPPQAPPQ